MEDESFEHIAGRLRRNEPGYSCLDLQMNPGFEARDLELLTEAVLANETLEAVDFFGILAGDDVNEATRRLVDSFGTLPKLKSLKFSGYCDEVLPVLEQVLNRVQNTLEHLNLTYVQLAGPGDTFANFHQALERLSNLTSFQLVDCQLWVRLREENALDDILRSLMQLPNLAEVTLTPIDPMALGTVSVDVVRDLCQMQNLSKLHIHIFQFANNFAHVESMASSLQSSTIIRDLQFHSSCNEASCNSIANLVRSTTGLESLHVKLMMEEKQDEKHILKIAVALQENTSLKTLVLADHIWANNSDSNNNNDDNETLATFGKLIESNYSIEYISFTASADACPLVSMYVRLNQLGRGELLMQSDQPSRQQWVDKLLEASVLDYLDGIYYFLSMNPLLCELPTS